jgi:hypothetical protein
VRGAEDEERERAARVFFSHPACGRVTFTTQFCDQLNIAVTAATSASLTYFMYSSMRTQI